MITKQRTKQEEIRERIAREYMAATDGEYRDGDGSRSIFVDQILSYLHSQGVVIKVEWELPEVYFETERLNNGNTNTISIAITDDIKKAYSGYTAVEPLIEEKI